MDGKEHKIYSSPPCAYVSLSITNVGAKFKIYDEECPKTIAPGESESCIISFVGNPVLMDLEDRPRNTDIMKQ